MSLTDADVQQDRAKSVLRGETLREVNLNHNSFKSEHTDMTHIDIIQFDLQYPGILLFMMSIVIKRP